MKKILNIAKVLSLVCLSAFLFSCSDATLNELNKNNDNPLGVDSKYILAEVITSTAFNSIGGDLSTYISSYVEHEVGVHNQLFNAETRSGEPANSSTFNNNWNSLYRNLKNARIVIDQCNEGGRDAGNLVTRGIAKVLAARTSGIIADMFGDAPWSEAAVVNADGSPKFMNPKIDKQEDIYKGIFEYLDGAIADLQGADVTPIGNYDLLYSGDKAKWTKLAYGLKARYTLRLLAKSADLDKILEYVSKSFATVGEQAAFNIYSASNLNPLYDFQSSRAALASSTSLLQKLIDRNDPRLRRVIVNKDNVQVSGPSDQSYLPAPNGTPEQLQNHYNRSIFTYSQLASTMYLSYHELLFIKAEALARKGSAEAEAVLKQAVLAAIANTEESVKAAETAPAIITKGQLKSPTAPVTPTEAADYFDTEVKPLFDTDPLKEIMIQKYLAFYGASGEAPEAYNDIRRLKALGENFITLSNPNNTSKFPLRCGYGNSDTTTNPAVKAAYGDGQYVYTEAVWWAGGTR